MKRLTVKTLTIQVEKGQGIVFEIPDDAQVVAFSNHGIYAVVQYVVPADEDAELNKTGFR